MNRCLALTKSNNISVWYNRDYLDTLSIIGLQRALDKALDSNDRVAFDAIYKFMKEKNEYWIKTMEH